MPLYDVSSSQYLSDAAATTFTPSDMPAHVTGDLILYVVGFDGTPASALTATGGWTVQDAGANSDALRLAFVYKIAASGSETAPTFTSPVSSNWGATVKLFRGAHATPIDSSAFNNAIAAGLTHTSPALSTTNNACGLLYAFASDCAANPRAYLSPNELVADQILAPSSTFVMMTGTRRQETAGSVPTVTARQDQSQGGQSLVIAIRSADGVNNMQAPPEGVNMVRFFSEHEGFASYSAPNTLAASINGINCHTAAPTGSEATASGIKNFGRGTSFLGTTTLNANYWEGPVVTGLSANLSTGLLSINWQINSTATNRIGAEGAIIVLKSSAGNWRAYQLRRRSEMVANTAYSKVFEPSTATVYASAGTVNLASIAEIGVLLHRSSIAIATANSMLLANLVQLTTAKLIGGGLSNPLGFNLLANQLQYFYGGVGWATALGTFTELRQSVEIGNNSINTYLDHSSGGFQFAANGKSAFAEFEVGANSLSLTVETTATGELDLSSSIIKTAVQQNFVIDAGAANPSMVSSGLSLIGFTPTLKTGFNFTSTVFRQSGEVDLKAATYTSCTFSGGTNTGGAAAKMDTGASLASCSFIKGAETYALRIPAAGTYSINGTEFIDYTTAINVTAASGPVTINLAAGQATPTYITAGATVVFSVPAIYFNGPEYADGTRYQLTHQQIFDVPSASINTGTDQLTLGNDTNGDAANLSIATSGYHTLVKIELAAGATMPTTTPPLVDGGVYRVKTNSAGVITLTDVEGGTAINFTSAGTNNGSGDLLTVTTETNIANGLVSGGSGLSVAIVRSTGARIRRRAIHYAEPSGVTLTSLFFDDIFLWSTAGNTTDSSEINNAITPWAVPNSIAGVSTITLKEPVRNSAGVYIDTVTPADAGSDVVGLDMVLEVAGKIHLNTVDADGIVPVFDLAVWFPYTFSTAAGIWIASGDTFEAIDLFNYRVTNLEVDEDSGTPTKFVGAIISGIEVAIDTTGSVALNVATTGNGAVISGGGGGATAADVWAYATRTITAVPTGAALEATAQSILTDTAALDARLPASPAAVGDIPSAAVIADAVWDEVLTGATHNVPTSAGRRVRQLGTRLALEGAVIGTPTTTSVQTDATQATSNFYNGQTFRFTSGVLMGQAYPVAGYNGTTKTFTFDEAFTSAPSAADTFEVDSDHVHQISQIQAGLATSAEVGAIPTAGENADAVRTELATELARIDVATSEAATPAEVATAITAASLATHADANVINEGVQLASLFIPHSTDLP